MLIFSALLLKYSRDRRSLDDPTSVEIYHLMPSIHQHRVLYLECHIIQTFSVHNWHIVSPYQHENSIGHYQPMPETCINMWMTWFKQYFISLYTYKYLTIYNIDGPGSDSKLTEGLFLIKSEQSSLKSITSKVYPRHYNFHLLCSELTC